MRWREVWRGRVLVSMPVRVVEDRDDLLAIHIPDGTPFSFPDPWPWGAAHPWAERGSWQGHGALVLHRPGDAYTVWVFWEGPERVFACWYVNLQAPFRRGEDTLDTFDHELDIVISPDGSWTFKDEDLLELAVQRGRFSEDEAATIRETGRRIAADLDRGARWWSNEWARWEPR